MSADPVIFGAQPIPPPPPTCTGCGKPIDVHVITCADCWKAQEIADMDHAIKRHKRRVIRDLQRQRAERMEQP